MLRMVSAGSKKLNVAMQHFQITMHLEDFLVSLKSPVTDEIYATINTSEREARGWRKRPKQSLGISFNSFVYSLFVLAFLVQSASAAAMQSRKTSKTHAMVVCAHREAAKVGKLILSRGGNAVDAAVAVQFALAVVYPNAGNIGGGGFMVWRSRDGDCRSLDFREKAPHLATKDMFLDPQGRPISRLSLSGALACGVPGSVSGMVEAHAQLGRLPWKQLLEPAIRLAKRGFALTEKQADELNEFDTFLRQWNDSTCALVRNKPWKAGNILRQPELAKTLLAIRDRGRAGFYEGPCADAIVESMRKNQGLIDHQDLAGYAAVWRPVLRGHFRDLEIIGMPPPSSGGIALQQLLSMWEQHAMPLPSYHSAEQLHLMTECQRRVYADRAEWLGDPDFVQVPIKGLLDAGYLAKRMSDYQADSATPSTQIKGGAPSVKESEQTTHFSIVDKYGNAVALTTTLNGSYGSKLMVANAGFLLNNEMDDFSAKPGAMNMYGLIGNERNAIAPHKRMLSSMTPTIICRDNKLYMVIGTPGGGTIMNSVLQCIVNVVDYHMPMQKAVEEPRFHSQWQPDVMYLEDGCLLPGVLQKLEKMGHMLKPRTPMGRVDAILVHEDGSLEAGADPRGDDCAESF